MACLVLTSVTWLSSSVDAAGDEPAIHFVIDVSGSMSGSKLNEAVEAIKITAQSIPDTTALGLRSYAGSCSQSSVTPLVPIGVANDPEIIAAADSLSAGGGTPTTAALEEGLNELSAYPTTGAKRLVLLTDGDTQCGISVCDFIQQRDVSGLEITLYTVGLQVSAAAASDLTCAAEFTGGSFITAEDPTDLADALAQATGGATDRDGDGLPDAWEDSGRDLGFGVFDLTLRDGGATSNHKDVFVRIDAEKGAGLSDEAVQILVDAFSRAPVSNPDGTTGIRLHIERGPQLSATESDALRQPSGEHAGKPDWPKIIERLSPVARNYYHYAISVNWETAKYAGMADNIPGQLMVINNCGSREYKNWLGQTRANTKCQRSAVSQAANFMHELGHTLGLHHGGAAPLPACDTFGACDMENPYKPNYLSVMSYNFSHSGIPGWGVDFSRWGQGDLYILDESSLSEYDGVLSPNGSVPGDIQTLYYCPDGTQRKVHVNTGVDWNCSTVGRGSGIEPGRISSNIDYPAYHRPGRELEATSLGNETVLSPFNDWHFLDTNSSAFRGGLIGQTSGLYGGGGYYA